MQYLYFQAVQLLKTTKEFDMVLRPCKVSQNRDFYDKAMQEKGQAV